MVIVNSSGTCSRLQWAKEVWFQQRRAGDNAEGEEYPARRNNEKFVQRDAAEMNFGCLVELESHAGFVSHPITTPGLTGQKVS